MCLTSDVDINVLAQCFELDPYDQLLKPKSPQDHILEVFELK